MAEPPRHEPLPARVTGADLVAESGRDVTELLDLGFGRCRLAMAVPEGWLADNLSG